MPTSPTLSSLTLYPLKAARGIDLTSALALAPGLAWDRRLMLVDPQGSFVSQRTFPKLALLSVTFDPPPSSALQEPCPPFFLSAPDLPPLRLDPSAPTEDLADVQIWRSRLTAEIIETSAAALLSAWLHLPLRIARLPASLPRKANPLYADPDTPVSFADGYPLLLCNHASLADLSARIGSPLSMSRFRPNLVVSGLPPWQEDLWLGSTFRLGQATFRVVKPCDRCSVTLLDPDTATPSSEPLKTLATFRKDPSSGHVFFGQNLLCISPGLIRLGDTFQPSPP